MELLSPRDAANARGRTNHFVTYLQFPDEVCFLINEIQVLFSAFANFTSTFTEQNL